MENSENQTDKKHFTEQDITIIMSDQHVRTGLGSPKFPQTIENYTEKEPTKEQLDTVFSMKLETSQLFTVLRYLNVKEPVKLAKERMFAKKDNENKGQTDNLSINKNQNTSIDKEKQKQQAEQKAKGAANNIKEVAKWMEVK